MSHFLLNSHSLSSKLNYSSSKVESVENHGLKIQMEILDREEMRAWNFEERKGRGVD